MREDSFHRHTAKAPLEDVKQTHPRGSIMVCFKGDASSEVNKHFSRTFKESFSLSDEFEDDAKNLHLEGTAGRGFVNDNDYIDNQIK